MRVTVSGAQADAFYEEVLSGGEVWTVKDANGIPAPVGTDGARAMPFWSKRSRAARVIDNVPAFDGFEPTPVPLEEWRSRWLPGLAKDRLLVGLNWSGGQATGFDLAPEAVERNLAAREGERV